MMARTPTGCAWVWQFSIPKSKRVAFHAEVLQATARRRAAAFDVLTSAIGEKLDSRLDVVHPKGVFSFRTWGIFLTLRPHYFIRNDKLKSKYECDL
jgi:hypothetical protein